MLTEQKKLILHKTREMFHLLCGIYKKAKMRLIQYKSMYNNRQRSERRKTMVGNESENPKRIEKD